ncbi:hypothetical protein PAXRUDRAFT_832237 [Paxillus rubicundulus Ve08.2h10]|uniref:Uncharacterized protein n=1 Tax=Paxillus rubicundulus Ve08.2h10 TaxID=930991 RepID=A0A0D0DRL9_9AGAM|nr:hypothetical protein PAXRUDRAFT_832237 [Paxillus rubicundulus Ve08.2h10]
MAADGACVACAGIVVPAVIQLPSSSASNLVSTRPESQLALLDASPVSFVLPPSSSFWLPASPSTSLDLSLSPPLPPGSSTQLKAFLSTGSTLDVPLTSPLHPRAPSSSSSGYVGSLRWRSSPSRRAHRIS